MRLAHAPIALALLAVLLVPVAQAQVPVSIGPLEGGARAVAGTIENLSDATLTIARANGERVAVDVSALDESFRSELRPGQAVRVLVGPGSGPPVAQGLVVRHEVQPAAMPRSPRP